MKNGGAMKTIESLLLAAAASIAATSKAAPSLSKPDFNSEIARCVALASDGKRLDCFDSVAKGLGFTYIKATSPAVESKWKVSRGNSPKDDSLTVTLSLDAESSISGWPGKTHLPTIILRCKERRTDAYIVTGMSPMVEYGTDDATVTLRFDKDKASKYRTSKSTDGEALFFGQAAGLVKQMMGKSELLFEFVPFNSSPAMTRFDLHGLTEAVKPLREACKW